MAGKRLREQQGLITGMEEKMIMQLKKRREREAADLEKKSH